jgi:undecaprenyl pyrophosphate phosphatase UppP
VPITAAPTPPQIRTLPPLQTSTTDDNTATTTAADMSTSSKHAQSFSNGTFSAFAQRPGMSRDAETINNNNDNNDDSDDVVVIVVVVVCIVVCVLAILAGAAFYRFKNKGFDSYSLVILCRIIIFCFVCNVR